MPKCYADIAKAKLQARLPICYADIAKTKIVIAAIDILY